MPSRRAPASRLASFNPKITDFGIARLLQAESRQTHDGAVIGTPQYMAPEQAAAENGRVGPAIDVYGLGVILYELLTGRVPLEGADTLDTLLRVRTQEPAPLRRLRPETPRDLEAVCLKCLEKSPERRYASAAQLADDLERFLQREPVCARPVTATGRTWRWCRRNPAVAALSATMAGLLLVATVSSWVAAFHFQRLAGDRRVALTQKEQALDEATRAKHRGERLLETARGAQRQATEELYESNVARADALRWSGRLGQRVGSLEGLRQAASLVEELEKPHSEVLRLRNAAINSMRLADLSIERTWQADLPLQFDPLLKRYIRLSESNDVLVFDYAGDRLLGRLQRHRLSGRREGRGAEPQWQKFSPDGRYLALGYHDRTWRVWDLDEQRLVREMRIRGGDRSDGSSGNTLGPFDFAPDGRSFAVLTPKGSVQIFAIDSGEPMVEIETGQQPRKLCYSPGGRRLALACRDAHSPSVQIYDLKTRRPGPAFRVHQTGWIAACAWSPDGRRIACGIEANKLGDITIWDAATGERIDALEGHHNSVHFLSFTPDGRWLVSASWDGTTRLWDLVPGAEVLRVRGGSRFLSRDGTCLSIEHSDSRRSMARLVVPREVLPVSGQAEFASPDGRVLAVLTPKEIRLVELDTSRVRARMAADDPALCRYHPNASCLFVADRNGIWRCPIRADASTGSFEFGQKALLSPQAFDVDRHWFEATPDGRLFARADAQEVRIACIDTGEIVKRLLHRRFWHASFHPAGKWIATGAYLAPAIGVRDVNSGRNVAQVPADDRFRRWQGLRYPQSSTDDGKRRGVMKFSPDGLWLVARSHDQYRFWETASWSLRHIITDSEGAAREGHIAFSPDGRLVALSQQLHHVRLYDLRDFSPLASFEHHEPRGIQRISFSPDGNYLLSRTERLTEVWDLRAVRRHLESMKLDWR